jgi:hypothetical protein
MLALGERVFVNGRNLGMLRLDNKFVTHRRERHFFRKFKGWGMSLDLLDKLADQGVEEIILIEHRDNGRQLMYKTTPSSWLKLGKRYKHVKFEEQSILPTKYFEEIEGN